MSDGHKPKLKSIPGGKADPGPAPATPKDADGADRVPASSEVLDPITTTREFAAAHPVVRKTFGRYELLMQMGTGGMANLYLARVQGPKKFEKLIAIKKIHAHLAGDAEFISMFQDEARIAALIHHPNVVASFDLGEIAGSYFIAMEYVHGQTLRDVVNASRRRREPLHWTLATRIISDVAKGLHSAHELRSHNGEPLGVIHRDISPHNVLVSYDGHVKLVDFGIAYAAEKLSDTGAGQLKGKLAYMSPEQAAGTAIDRRSDIFSLGAVLFEALTQQRLFDAANEAETVMRVRAAEVPFLNTVRADIPGELDVIVQCALARDPEGRFETAEQLAEALDELLVLRKLRPGNKQIAGLMEDLFGERKRIKDRMVRRALADTTDTPLQGIEIIDDDTASVQTADPHSGGEQSGRRISPLFYVIGTALVLLLAGLVAILAWPKDDAKKASGAQGQPPRTRPSSMRKGPVTTTSVMLTVRVSPKDAKSTITFRNEVQKGPVFQAVLSRSSTREEVTIAAEGYRPRKIPIVLAQALTLPVELVPTEKTRKRRRRRKTKTTGTGKRPKPMRLDSLLRWKDL